MSGEDRRVSVVYTSNPFIEITDTTVSAQSSSPPARQPTRTPSPTDEILPWKQTAKSHRHRLASETQYADTEVEELLAMLRETESLEEQGDILQYLVRLRRLLPAEL